MIFESNIEKSFSLDTETKRKKVDKLIEAISDDPRIDYRLSSFLIKFRDVFFDKFTTVDYPFEGIVIPKGSKIIKAFHYFIKNKQILEEYQNYASRIIQEDKIKGHLCFSVHPLDYLSISESTLKWRSCHALDGEYRAGNLAYMIDTSTVICYLKTDKDEILPNFPVDVPWNNKKWRMLLYFSEDKDMVFACRQYPFSSQEILNYLLDSGLLCNLFLLGASCNWSEEWREDTIFKLPGRLLNEVYIPYRGYLYEIRDLFNLEKDRCFTKLAFNDVISSSCYDPMWIVKNDYSSSGKKGEHPIFHVADEYVPCLDCGEHYLNQTDMMVCRECYDDYYCECVYCELCGRRIYSNDDSYELSSGGTVCRDCAEEHTVLCNHCGMLEVRSSAKVIDENGEVLLCPHCRDYWYENLSEEEKEELLLEELGQRM